mgnify:CR=1 FL=1
MKRKLLIGKNVYEIEFQEFEDEIDVDELMTIHYENLVGEIITFPVVVNRGLLLADAERALAETKLNCEIMEAKVREEIRTALNDEEDRKKPATVDEVNTAVYQSPVYKANKLKLFEAQKTRDYVASLLFSAKDKSSKLDKLSLSIPAGDIEEHLLQSKANSVMKVRKRRKLIPDEDE